jgi:Tat protein secretion system quality control protein TatD with DNase activity
MNQNVFIVDSHCHLNYEGLKDRVPEVIKAANDAGGKSAAKYMHPPYRI